jgi:hypothetical protein
VTAPLRVPIPADVRVDFTGPTEQAPAGLVLVASPAAVEALIGDLVAAHPTGILVVADLLDGQLTRAEARMHRTLAHHGLPAPAGAGPDPAAVA